ncbi:hypothetical protein QVD17_35941 [Tagetes erecta]|uniref:Uncharacterized protein n=1 Tax=Tagetes erecta TaxID=13708 RepID=A0AAD8JRF0_TARER|nr:hypothetical protein QVD17_35941 [Tagetes erecta]
MSDTLTDLSSSLPSQFLPADLFPPHRLPYDFASSSSTESESDDDDFATRRFTRSVSLQDRHKFPNPYLQKKRGFSGSPESTLNWNVSPTNKFVQADEDALDLLYARMKMKTINDGVFLNRGLIEAHRLPFIRHNRYRTISNENQVFLRQQHFREMVSGAPNNFVGRQQASPVVFGHTAWTPLSVQNQRRQQPSSEFAGNPIPVRFAGECGRGTTVAKKGCAGTGVFLPRSYNNIPPPAEKQVYSPANLPTRVTQSNINRQHHHNFKCNELAEMIMVHRQNQNGVMLAQQRRTGTYENVPETRLVQAEVVLPQEWTY